MCPFRACFAIVLDQLKCEVIRNLPHLNEPAFFFFVWHLNEMPSHLFFVLGIFEDLGIYSRTEAEIFFNIRSSRYEKWQMGEYFLSFCLFATVAVIKHTIFPFIPVPVFQSLV